MNGLDPLDVKVHRPIAWVPLEEGQGWVAGRTCSGCQKETLSNCEGIRVRSEGTPNGAQWVCTWCGKETEDPPEILLPDAEGYARVYATINGAVDSNPFLNPITSPFGRPDQPADQVQYWLEAGYTDLGNAKRLVDLHAEKFRYVPAFRNFLVYDGFRWVRDQTASMERYAKHTVEVMIKSASSLQLENEQYQKFIKHAMSSCSSGRIKAMIELARSDPRVTMTPEQFDRPAHLLNCRNGVLDLATGTLLDPEPTDYLTRLAHVEYDAEATCPTWDDFVHVLAHKDEELVAWLQKAVGYTLTGETSEQTFFFMFGDGANGKTTFLEILRDLLGDYAATLSFEVFLRNTRGNVEHALAALPGVRLATASEAPEGRAWNEEVLKHVTGGDQLRASRKYENAFEFTPVAKIWFAANHQPHVNGVDEGIWRRFVPIPARSHLAEHERDGQLPEKLRAEMPGILAWAARGAQLWYEEGLKPYPEVIQAALAEYRTDSDILGRFIEDCCELDPGYETPAAHLLKTYNEWSKDVGERKFTATMLGRRLAKYRGGLLRKGKDVTGRVAYQGIRIIDLDDEGRPRGLEAFE